MALALGTGAWMYIKCPQCGKEPGEQCRMPSGRKTPMSHGVRVQKYMKEVPDAMEKATLKACSFADFVEDLREKVGA